MGRRRGKEIRIYAELQRVLLYRLNNAGVSCCAEAAAAKASTSANSGSRFQKHFHIRRLNQTLVCNIYRISPTPKVQRAQGTKLMNWEVWGGTSPLIFKNVN